MLTAPVFARYNSTTEARMVLSSGGSSCSLRVVDRDEIEELDFDSVSELINFFCAFSTAADMTGCLWVY